MALKEGESGKTLRVAAGFDMSSNTELTLNFIKPDGTTVSKASADGVTLGAGVTDNDLGTLSANEYVEYPVETGFLDQDGDWQVYIEYTNTGASPSQTYFGETTTFTVDAVP